MSHDSPTEPMPRLDDTNVAFEAQQGRPAAPHQPTVRRRWPRILALLVAVTVLAAVTGWGAAQVRQQRDVPPAAAPSSAAAVVPVSVTSLDPVGGSGFESDTTGSARVWRTQTYTSADFGRLKPGVGLVLDLGSPRPLSAVTFDAGPAPITVELRAADSTPTATAAGLDAAVVTGPVSATGATTLAASTGGAHRYWVVWVSRLGARDGGGFGATIEQVTTRG